MSSLSIIEYHFLRPVYRCQYNVNSHLYIGSTIACQSQRSSEHGNFLSFYRSVCLNNKPIVLLLLTLSPSQPVKRQPELNQLMYRAGLTLLSRAIIMLLLTLCLFIIIGILGIILGKCQFNAGVSSDITRNIADHSIPDSITAWKTCHDI